MPLSADPSDTFPFSLKAHRSLPIERRPIFHLKFLSARESRKAEKELFAIKANINKGADAALDALDATILIGLKSTENVNREGVEYSMDNHKPSDFLNIGELYELAYAVAIGSYPSEDELKNSGSQAGSASEPSAPIAPEQIATTLLPK